MPIERYLAELTPTFDVSDDLIIHRKVEYETYAANPEDAEATARLWAYDFRKKLAENTANYVNPLVSQGGRCRLASRRRRSKLKCEGLEDRRTDSSAGNLLAKALEVQCHSFDSDLTHIRKSPAIQKPANAKTG